MSAAIDELMIGCQASLAVGEAPLRVNTENVRLLTTVASGSSLGNTTLSPPTTDYEALASNRVAEIALNGSRLSIGATVGVSIVQYNNQPEGLITNSTAVILNTVEYSVIPSSSSASTDGIARRRLADR